MEKRKQKVTADLIKTRQAIKTSAENVESLVQYQKQLEVDVEQAEKSRNHTDIVKILQRKHLHQMPSLQSRGITAIQNLLCSSKSEEFPTIALDVSYVAAGLRQRKWAEHAPITDSQKNHILMTSTWVTGVANVVKVAQSTHKSAIGATLNTNFQKAMEHTLQTVVVDTKPAVKGVQDIQTLMQWTSKQGYSDFVAKMFEMGIFSMQELSCRAGDVTEFIAKSLGYKEAHKFKNDVRIAVSVEAPASEISTISVAVLQKKQIVLGPKIGEGNFGVVHKGSTTVEHKDVAIKLLKSEPSGVLKELKTMSKLIGHANLLRIIGICPEPLMLVLELAPLGNLKNHLEDQYDPENDGPGCTAAVFWATALQICRGMAILTSHGIVHRDLALRNILVMSYGACDAAAVHVKVSDFGMSVEGAYAYGGATIPTRWVPPEVLRRMKWSTKSDVWAFGITVWEALTYGLHPYEDMNDSEVKKFIKNGNRLSPPDAIKGWESTGLWDIVQTCWEHKAKDRPTFADLERSLSLSKMPTS